MRYVLVLMMLITACNLPYAPEISKTPAGLDSKSRTDAGSKDTRNYSDGNSNIIGPEKDAAFWIQDQEVSVTTDFPAPSWWR